MIKLDIINHVAERTGVPKMKAEIAVEALFEAMKAAMKNGERIELRGFGVFVVMRTSLLLRANRNRDTRSLSPAAEEISNSLHQTILAREKLVRSRRLPLIEKGSDPVHPTSFDPAPEITRRNPDVRVIANPLHLSCTGE